MMTFGERKKVRVLRDIHHKKRDGSFLKGATFKKGCEAYVMWVHRYRLSGLEFQYNRYLDGAVEGVDFEFLDDE